MTTLHENEVPVDEATLRRLLRAQRPEWAELPLAPAGSGTDNRMFRLGSELLLRLPRTAENAAAVRKEQTWLPRLGPALPFAVPEPVHEGAPDEAFPLAWSVYRWIEGGTPGPGSVDDWAAFGAELAAAVRALHALPLPAEEERAGLSWYRGGELAPCDGWVRRDFAAVRAAGAGTDPDLDLARLHGWWREALRLPAPTGPRVWLHGDLKPSNLLVRDGALHAVIDFGGLSIGFPDAEHAPVWDLPAPARRAYWAAAGAGEESWLRARAWAIAVGVAGLSYYRERDPAFAAECRSRLLAVLADTEEGTP
ncbi:aminoglycoside phosphotransferase family protein [Kitasatospora sp. NPDC088134]|uniref:aminoglycoside phosphotransferase family protein n=1 Tax=Kitasatospora sp. NPDC088134 TaxID=3364071 RepID=UPI0037FC8B2A